eukprot:gene34026-43961_t
MADATPLIYIGGSLCALGLYFGCLRLLDDLFPRGIRFFDPIELEEIKIERMDDVENSLKSSIQTLKDKMSFSRQKKTALLADRDLRVVIDENVQANNNVGNGRNIYGEAWEANYKGKSVPVKAERPVIQKEKVSEEEEEVEVEDEKIDLWQMWNHIREDGKKVDMRDSYNKGKKNPVAIVNDESDYNYSDTTRFSKNLPAPLLKNNLNIGTTKRQELHSLSINHSNTANNNNNNNNNNGKSDSLTTPRGQIGMAGSLPIRKPPPPMGPPPGFRKSSSDADNSKNKNI